MIANASRLVRASIIVGSVIATAACSTAPAAPVVKAGPMPTGGAWQGVYAESIHGELNLVVSGRRADGAWKTPAGVHGTLWGAVDGNTLHYMWSERRKNERGEPIAWFGRGYFVYKVVDAKTQVISGEW